MENLINAWEVYMDKSCNPIRSGAGLVLLSPEGVIAEHALHFEFLMTNNEVEYEVLIT